MQIKSDRASSEILTHLKALLLINDEEKDSLLLALLENAYAFACAYCGAEQIPSAILVRMVCEDYSRGMSGATKRVRGGMSEEYESGYDRDIRALLSSLRKIKAL